MSTRPSLLHGAPHRYIKGIPFVISGYVLTDYSHVLCLRDIHKAFGFDVKLEMKIFELLQHINRFTIVSADLIAAIEKPLELSLEATQTPVKVLHAHFLPVLLQTIIDAKNNGYLNVNQLKAAKVATLLLAFFLKNNLNDVIDESSGYNFYKSTAKKSLQQTLLQKDNQPAFLWTHTLPDSFFKMLTDLFGFDWTQVYEDPNMPAKTINDVVFSRLTDISIRNLSDNKPKRTYKTVKTQANQHPDLEKYLNSLQQLAFAAKNHPQIFLRLLDGLHPKNQFWPVSQLEFISNNKETAVLSAFNTTLAKSFSVDSKNK